MSSWIKMVARDDYMLKPLFKIYFCDLFFLTFKLPNTLPTLKLVKQFTMRTYIKDITANP